MCVLPCLLMKAKSQQQIGGLARAASLSPAARSESASKAAQARWEAQRAAQHPQLTPEEVQGFVASVAIKTASVLDLLERDPIHAAGPAVELGGQLGAVINTDNPKQGAAAGAMVGMGLTLIALLVHTTQEQKHRLPRQKTASPTARTSNTDPKRTEPRSAPTLRKCAQTGPDNQNED